MYRMDEFSIKVGLGRTAKKLKKKVVTANRNIAIEIGLDVFSKIKIVLRELITCETRGGVLNVLERQEKTRLCFCSFCSRAA